MGLKKISITKGIVGANATATETSTSAILATGVAVATKLSLDTVYSVTSLKQAEDTLGIDAAYDTANNVVLHQHIVDFYSFKGNENVKLFIMVVDKESGTMTPASWLEDTGALYAKKLITAGGGTIKQMAFVFNPKTSYTETVTNGVNADIYAAIPKAEALYDWAYGNDMPCQVFLEGRGMSATKSTWQDLRNIVVGASVLEADHVTVVAGQDYDYAETRTGLQQKYAGVCKYLGAIALAAVNQSGGEVGPNSADSPFNLSDAVKGLWLTPGLSDHSTNLASDAYLTDIDDKGYVFAYQETGVTGLRFNGDATCTPIKIDEDGHINEHTVYYGRTLDYAALRLKAHLLPLLRARVSVDPKTGKLPTAVIKNIEAGADTDVFGKMVNEGLCSGGKTQVDANSNVMPPDNKLGVSFNLVPTGILSEVDGTIYLSKSI